MVTTVHQFDEIMQPDPNDDLVAELLARVEVEIKAAGALGQKKFSVPVGDKYVPVMQRVTSTYQSVGWQVTTRHEPHGNDHYLDFVRP